MSLTGVNIESENGTSPVPSVSLLRELQHSLYEIARRAELDGLKDIELQADSMLRLVDSYQLAAQLERGQVALALEPCGLGSVMHDVAYDVKLSTGMDVAVVAKAHAPAMVHRRTLAEALFHIASAVTSLGSSRMHLGSMRYGDMLGVGVFSAEMSVTAADLKKALEMSELAHMPLAGHSSRSVIQLTLAERLLRIVGGHLEVRTYRKQRGIVVLLPRSEQLSLVGI